jgi:hypothetical protein
MTNFADSADTPIFTEKEYTDALQKAKVEAYTDSLLQIIRWAFGRIGLAGLEPRVRQIDDVQKLESLIKPALYTRSVKEFEKTVEEVILTLKK